MKNSETGHSLLQILSTILVLAVVGATLTVWGTDIYRKAKLSGTMTDFSVLLSNFSRQSPELIQKKENVKSVLFFKLNNIFPQCEIQDSELASENKSCRLPLGEFTGDITYADSSLYTYLYVHFTDMYKKRNCNAFLSYGWEKIIPADWWGEYGYIGVLSETDDGKMFYALNDEFASEGAKKNPTEKDAKNACSICEDSRYCSIMFFFMKK